ncbi:hypothetical protein D3C81_2198640 [compost metagenome]
MEGRRGALSARLEDIRYYLELVRCLVWPFRGASPLPQFSEKAQYLWERACPAKRATRTCSVDTHPPPGASIRFGARR